MRKQTGFTLIELMIVVAIIAIIAAIAIPNLLSARLNANETAAISTLRNISSAQAQFQASSKADLDSDGAGEFGFFTELSGGAGVRTDATGTRGSTLNPPVLSGAFRTLGSDGTVSRSGYKYMLLLPQVDGNGSAENQDLSQVGTVDADLSETTWCGYAWPANYSTSGNRTFFTNQKGDITAKDDPVGSPYSQGSAFIPGGDANDITGRVAVGTVGNDGQVWKQVN